MIRLLHEITTRKDHRAPVERAQRFVCEVCMRIQRGVREQKRWSVKLLVLLVSFAVSWYCVSGVLRGLVQLLFRATAMLREKEKKVELPRS